MDQTVAREESFSAAHRGDALVEQVHAQICQALLTGQWAPGDRLNISSLAAAMDVSATPVREALSRLISDGALRTDDKRAICVPRLNRAELEEIFDLRVLIEGELAEAAVARISEVELADIRLIQKELVVALNGHEYKEALKLNARFHFRIYEAAGCPLALKLARSLWVRIGPTMHFHYPLLDYTREGIRRHQQIIEQIRKRNGKGLRAAMIEDLKGSLATIKLEQT
ncbi:MAG: GntR family transcriptional regulator [Gammaproteobacteria bacterium]